MKILRDNVEYCPFCNVNLQGEPIPKESQSLFGATHFSRKIGLYNMHSDRTEQWLCPDCNNKWDRV